MISMIQTHRVPQTIGQIFIALGLLVTTKQGVLPF
jgi:hypothetical protein